MSDVRLLEKPFDASQIRQRPGPGGITFDYVPTADVIRRVLEATDGAFDWTVHRVDLMGEDGRLFWLVHGTLAISGLGSRDGIGAHAFDGIDSPKSAESDAFKRAATKFGVALGLNGEEANGTVSVVPVPEPIASATNGSSPCSNCHAPAGKLHASRCPARNGKAAVR